MRFLRKRRFAPMMFGKSMRLAKHFPDALEWIAKAPPLVTQHQLVNPIRGVVLMFPTERTRHGRIGLAEGAR